MLKRPPRFRRLSFSLTSLGVLFFLFAPASYAWYPYLDGSASCDPPTQQDPTHCKCTAAVRYEGNPGEKYVGSFLMTTFCYLGAEFTGNVFEETKQNGTGYYIQDVCSTNQALFEARKSPVSGIVTVPKCQNAFNVPVDPILQVSFAQTPKPLTYGKTPPANSFVEVRAQVIRSNGKFSNVSYSDSSNTTPVMQNGTALASGSWAVVSKFTPSAV